MYTALQTATDTMRAGFSAMNFAILLIFFTSFTTESNAANILFGAVHFSKSHLLNMLPFAEALSLRGHNVTVYTAMKGKATMPTQLENGVTGQWVIVPVAMEEDAKTMGKMAWTMDFNALLMAFPFNMGNNALNTILSEQPDAWWSVANQTWDLIFADQLFCQSSYALSLMSKQRNGKPFALFSPSHMPLTFASIKSLSRNPAVVPSFYTTPEPFRFDAAIFWDRVKGIRDFLSEYLSESQITFQDFPERMIHPMPIGNEIINIGATCATSNEEISEDLLEFINDKKSKGTIYIAFGSNVHWNHAPERVFNAFLTTIEQLKDYRVIWGYRGPPLNVSDHVKILSWAPQIAILNHPKTRLFVSHGGLKSLKEAMCSETPVLYMSIFAEQIYNALIAKHLGFAEFVNKHTVTGEDLLRQARKVLENDSYLKNVKKVNAVNGDRIMHPLEEGTFWVEKTIKYETKPTTFHRFGINLNWIQYCFIELVTLSLLAIFFVAT